MAPSPDPALTFRVDFLSFAALTVALDDPAAFRALSSWRGACTPAAAQSLVERHAGGEAVRAGLNQGQFARE